ncbi:c-type cytochrome domain-containing protein [Pontiella agarivorans]|uniref:Cytochrome c domain-containing protein n=1 Tax=Pontiella agarivorans TaxID=3038953 RepID=A0ABU5MSP4_9BACT|nr:c-type cytochrome domain-containing protein [Pontiella agarivorans]MDZ8117224.1 hypothetical protein [Pontiella agarivorans]
MRFKLTLLFGSLTVLILLPLPFVFPLSGNPGSDAVAAVGRFHILILHFPIALLLIVPLLELLSRFTTLNNLREANLVILFLCLLFGITTCIFGYALALGDGGAGELLQTHMQNEITATVLMALTLILKVLHLDRPCHGSGVLYLSALLLSISVLVAGSHHGASMVHGEDYLYAKLPTAFQNLFNTELPKPADITADASAYEAVIQPIFERNCYFCHSAAMEMGGFRMDVFERLMAGGDGGMPGIEPGSLQGSEVHYRITLDPSSNAFMPPNGRPPLTDEETALVSWWIASGASPTASISELDPPPAALTERLSGQR